MDGSGLNYLKLSALPTVSAAVLLRDAVLVVAPDVDGGADQRHQHSEAAEEGEDGHALLLALWMDEQTLNRHYNVVLISFLLLRV